MVSGQRKGREQSPTHQEKFGLKIYWAWPRPLEQDPVSPSVSLSHQEASISLLPLFIRQEKAMATHFSTLAWKIPWTEEPGRLPSMGLWRVRHDWVTSLSLFTFMHWRGKWQHTPLFFPGESQGRSIWWAAIYGVAQSWTWLKWLSSSSSSFKISSTIFRFVL